MSLSWAREHFQKESLTYICVFPQCQVYQGRLSIEPLESHAGYTQRRGAHELEGSRSSSGCEVWFTTSASEEAGIGLKPGGCTVAGVLWSRSPAGLQAWPLVQPSLSVGWSELWVLSAHQGLRSHLYRCPDGVFTQVSRLVVLCILGLSQGPCQHTPLPQDLACCPLT